MGGEGDDDGARSSRLTLLRHGRAAPPAAGLDDHERPLLDSGREDVVATLSLGAVRADPPGRVLCSTARRTVETARCAVETLGLDADCVALDARLYLAAPETILALVAALGLPDGAHVMVVGHNPGLEALAVRLDGRATGAMPTAGLCRFALRGAPDAAGREDAARLLLETRPPGRGDA